MSRDAEDAPHTPTLFRCPSCGASLEVVDAPAVTCKYCGTNVPVPASLRPQTPQVIIQTSTVDYSPQYAEAVRAGQRFGCIFTIVLLLIIGGIAVFALVSSQTAIHSAVGEVSNTTGIDIQLPGATPTPSFAEVVMEFGGKGTGPGLFDDARYVTVDPDGNIFVAEYDSGRMQQFDPTGKFLRQMTIEPDRNANSYVSGMATDYEGHLYVSRGGDILKYSVDGELLATFPADSDTRYGPLAVDASNVIYAMNDDQEGLVKLDADGNELHRVPDLISSVDKDDFSFSVNVAVDGTGQIYVTSGFGNKVYVFDSQGKYIDHSAVGEVSNTTGIDIQLPGATPTPSFAEVVMEFGEEGTQPGQLSSPGAIAVDGRGRIYVDTFGGISVFNTGGAHLGDLPRDYTKGAVMGLTVDIAGDIYAVTNGGLVIKYRLTPKG